MSTQPDPDDAYEYQMLCTTLKNVVIANLKLQDRVEKSVQCQLESLKNNILNYAKDILKITKSVNNNDPQDDSDTPLHLAVQIEDIEILEMLLLKGAAVNAKNNDLETPLHLALQKNAKDVVNLLLKNGADPKIVNADNHSSFHFLLKFGNESMINIFLENQIAFDFSGRKCLEIAFAKNLLNMVQLVLDHSNDLEELDISGYKLIHEAVKTGNIEIVKLILKKGFNINATSDTGTTPLQIAVNRKLEDIVQFLINNNADVNSKDNTGKSILHEAVTYDYKDFFKIFVDENGCPNIGDCFEEFYATTDKEFRKILKILLENGADFNVKDSEGYMPLHRAVENSKKELVKLLLEKGCDINATTRENSLTPLDVLIFLNKNCWSKVPADILKYLLENGANTKAKDAYEMTPLHHVIEKERFDLVNVFLDNNPDPYDKDYKLAFCLSLVIFEFMNIYYLEYFERFGIQHKNLKIIAELFFSRGYTLELEDFNDFHVPEGLHKYLTNMFIHSRILTAAQNILNKKEATNPAEVMKVCLKYKVLISSVQMGFTHIVHNLLTPDVNVNAPLHTRWTLLHLASKYGHLSIVEEFLKRGADVNAVNFDNTSALHFSVMNDYVDIARLLLKNRAYIDARNEQNQTPLFLAVRRKSYECVRLLLNAGANCNSFDVSGRSPLHAAVDNADKKCVEVLLHYGASTNGENFRNVFDTEVRFSDLKTDTVNLLFDHGAKMIGLHNHVSYLIYEKFMIKSIAANVDELDFPEISRNKDFQINCQEEIEKMKLMKIDEFNVSIHYMLIKHDTQIAIYMRNESIVRIVKSMDFKTLFPIFASKLEVRLSKGRRFNRLLEMGYHCFEIIFKLKMPSVVMNKIFSYCEEPDLRCLIIASPIDSKKKALIEYND